MERLRVLALIEPGRGGEAVLAELRELAAERPIELLLTAIAPPADRPRCGVSPADYDAAVRESVAADLAAAVTELGAAGIDANARPIVPGGGPGLAELAGGGGHQLVVLPPRRLCRGGGHPDLRTLENIPGVHVRIAGW